MRVGLLLFVLFVHLKNPKECDEIVSEGARGADTLAAEPANNRGIRLTEFLPDYVTYGKAAPIVRNRQIINYADAVTHSGTAGQREQNMFILP